MNIIYREDIFVQQEHQKKIEQEWECERKKLLHTIEMKEWYVSLCMWQSQHKQVYYIIALLYCCTFAQGIVVYNIEGTRYKIEYRNITQLY